MLGVAANDARRVDHDVEPRQCGDERGDGRRIADVEGNRPAVAAAGRARTASTSAPVAPVTVTAAPHSTSASAIAAPMPLVPPRDERHAVTQQVAR